MSSFGMFLLGFGTAVVAIGLFGAGVWMGAKIVAKLPKQPQQQP